MKISETDNLHVLNQMCSPQELQSCSDQELMKQIQMLSTDGIEELFRRHARTLRGLGLKVLQSNAEVDDLIQDVFLEVWNRSGHYDPRRGSPLSWLATITKRRAIDRIRKCERISKLQDEVLESSDEKVAAWSHVHQEVSMSETCRVLQEALDRLPEAQGTALRLAYQENMSQREIARETGIPLGTIKTRLELGLRKLAFHLKGFEELLFENRSPQIGDGVMVKSLGDKAT